MYGILSRWRSVALVVAAGAMLVACSTTVVPLPYLGGAGYAPLHPMIAMGRVTDDRGEKPNFLGEVRNGFGAPVQLLETPMPVADLVARDFAEALALRGLLAIDPADDRYDMDVSITRLDGNQVAHWEGVTEFTLSLRRHATGEIVYTEKTFAINKSSDVDLLGGVFASTTDLHRIIVRTLTQAINASLAKPGFVAVLNGPM